MLFFIKHENHILKICVLCTEHELHKEHASQFLGMHTFLLCTLDEYGSSKVNNNESIPQLSISVHGEICVTYMVNLIMAY